MSRPAFVRSAGIIKIFASRSTSCQRACALFREVRVAVGCRILAPAPQSLDARKCSATNFGDVRARHGRMIAPRQLRRASGKKFCPGGRAIGPDWLRCGRLAMSLGRVQHSFDAPPKAGGCLRRGSGPKAAQGPNRGFGIDPSTGSLRIGTQYVLSVIVHCAAESSLRQPPLCAST